MGRKYIQIIIAQAEKKIYVDNLKKIHKRRQRKVPAIPTYDQKLERLTDDSCSEEMEFEALCFQIKQ